MEKNDQHVKSAQQQVIILSHLVSLLYEGTHIAILLHTLNAALLIVSLRGYVSHMGILIWSAGFIAVTILRAYYFALYQRDDRKADHARRWLSGMKLIAFLLGTVWGGAAWVFMPESSVVHQLFTVTIIIVIASGASSKLYPVLEIYGFFVIPILLLVVARLVMIGTPLHFAVGASAAVLLMFLSVFAKRHRDELLQSLTLRMENEKLFKKLEQENKKVVRENTEKTRMEKLLRKKTIVLDGVLKVQALYISNREPSEVFQETLDIILDLTGSDFGFIGEVHLDETGQRYLISHAESKVVWDEETRRLLDGVPPVSSITRRSAPEFGDVLVLGEPVIANDLGRPVLKSIMAAPLYIGERLVGVIGIANRKNGYDLELLTLLEAVLSACAQMIEAVQNRRERDQAQRDLVCAMEETKKASRAKTEFLSSMSHELRTPMNAVLGFAQLLQMNPQVPLHEKQADSVDQILKAGNHLLELINEILDLSRIEAGRINLNVEEVDPHDVLIDCVSYVTPLANRKGVTLQAEVPRHGRFCVHADHTRLRQVLLNLLSNAVKYNVDGGTVSLGVEQVEPGFLRFLVSDTGPGIAKEKQSELFEPFSRLGAETTDIEGTGIGLTISRDLTDMMGGHLDFDSEPGRGSDFWIDIPGNRTAVKSKIPELASIDIPQLPAGGHTILYVEDNPDNLNLMDQIIAMLDNTKLLSAPTGELGLELARAHHPDVILLDIHLPGIDGYEVFRRLRESAETAAIPIIAISAAAMPSDVQHGLDAGFDAYLTKPVHIGQVIEHVAKALDGELGPSQELKN